ncbi:ATP/GTP-binding protein, partial [Actinomyces naeslundii]
MILGENLNGPGTLCADHMAWFERRIISAPSAMVMGLNGLGKSTLIRRIMLGLANRGIHSMILGDIKPDYVDAVEALGGQVVRIGHGLAGINPLDAGNVAEAARMLADHPQERAALLQAAH